MLIFEQRPEKNVLDRGIEYKSGQHSQGGAGCQRAGAKEPGASNRRRQSQKVSTRAHHVAS